ncbi:MAG: hypothetical protein ACNA8K_15390 [Cyclonatronaceae bacterium]
MDFTLFFAILNLILLARLRLTFRDRGATITDQVLLAAVPMLILPFLQIGTAWFILLAWLLLVPGLTYLSERVSQNLNRNRGLLLLLHILVAGMLSSAFPNLQPGLLTDDLLKIIHQNFLPIASVNWLGVHVVLFGLLLIVNEMNIIIRYLMEIMNLKPLPREVAGFDEQDYNTGRVIGLLERIFIYILVLAGQFTAVGFILTAKGIIRYPELKNKTFAEYVLIGTLLSALSALVTALFVGSF